MAYLGEAFNTFESQDKFFQNIDYFFTQRQLIEESELIDKNMNRVIKKKKVIYNFLAINIPNISIITSKENCISSFRDSRSCETNNTTTFRDPRSCETNNTNSFRDSRSCETNDEYTINSRENLKSSKKYDSSTFDINNINKNTIGFDIEIFGDEDYHYKGTIKSFHGIIPNFMIPIKKDKKLFIHIDYKIIDNNQNISIKKFINFIDVPKRYQSIIDNNDNTTTNESEHNE